MNPSSTRVAHRHLCSREQEWAGIRTTPLADRLEQAKKDFSLAQQTIHEEWWQDLAALFQSYWSFQRFPIKIVRGKMSFAVQGVSGTLNVEVRGPISKPTIYVGGAEKTFSATDSLEEMRDWIDGIDRTRAPRRARVVNKDDPGALLGLLVKLVKRDLPEALEASKSFSRDVGLAWGRREEQEVVPRAPKLNKEKPHSVLEYLYWLVVHKNGLEDLKMNFRSFERLLDAS